MQILHFTNMKGMNLSCASPASTAICSTMDQKSVIRPGTRAIDRHNPQLREGRRSTSSNSRALTPCPSYPSRKPKTYHHHENTRKSSANTRDLLKGPSPHGSSRYLLSNTAFFDVYSEFDPFSALVPVETSSSSSSSKLGSISVKSANESQSPVLMKSASTSTTRPTNSNQVVVLRVSLHCKGCEGKVRKHISKMEGVTSFSIDFAAKKVTVVGDITPLGVLTSVSRVKNAQFWPSSSASAPSSSMPVGFAY